MVYEVKSTAKAIADKQLGIQARETLTARVHKKMFPTLRCLTAKCIWDNRRLFDHSEDTNLFACLPILLRTNMLHQFSRHYFLRNFNEDVNAAACEGSENLSNRIMSLLLNQKLVSFKFPKYILYYEQDKLIYPENPFWKMLLLKCPMLLALSCSRYHVACTQHSLFLDALMSMKHLQVLKLHKFSVGDSTLCLIAQNIPNLRILKVEVTQIASKNTMSAMASLRHLEEFAFFMVEECSSFNCNHFATCQISRMKKWFINKNNLKLCLQSLPHLKFAGLRLVFRDDTVYNQDLWSFMARNTTDKLQCLEVPCTLGLQEVAASYLPEGINLPNLTSLHLYHPSSLFKYDDSRLAKITELNLFKADWYNCINIVCALGPQLKILRIIDCLDTLESFSVDVVLNMCSNLEHLALIECPLKKFMMVHPVDLTNLKVLEILSTCSFDIRYDDSLTGVLRQLLQAPQLRKLVISPISILPEKLVEEITSMLQLQQILQKLEQVVLRRNIQDSYLRSTDNDNLLDSMILHCPKLINVARFVKKSLPLLDSCWDGRNSSWDTRNSL